MSRGTGPSDEKALTTTSTGKALQPPSMSSLPFEELWLSQSRRGVTGDAIVGTALEALRYNRLRSFLTMLGVIIGVSAVITVVILSQGVNQSVSQRFASLGTNVITISSGAASAGGAFSAAGSEQTLTLGDADALATLPHIVNVSPLLTSSGQVIYGSQNWNTSVRGVYPSYQEIQSWQIAEGSWFSDEAEQTSAPDAVLGQTVVQNLFPAGTTDPIGQTVRINSQLFRVVGTLQAKGSQGLSNSDDVIFVPFSAANERLKPSPLYVDQIQLQVDNVSNFTQVQQAITTLLRTRHHLAGAAPSTSSSPGQRSGSALGGGFIGGGTGGGGRPFGGGGSGSGRGSGSGSGTSTQGSGSASSGKAHRSVAT